MNRILEIETQVYKEFLNIKKSRGRPRSLQGILEKTLKLKELKQEFKLQIDKLKYRVEHHTLEQVLKIYETIKNQVKESIKILDETPVLEDKRPTVDSLVSNNTYIVPLLKTLAKNAIDRQRHLHPLKPLPRPNPLPEPKMPTETFDLKTATALVQPYDGSPGGLAAFLDAANLLNELTASTHQTVAVKFLKTRLTGKARIGLPDTAITIKLVAENVEQRCAIKVAPETIIAKLEPNM